MHRIGRTLWQACVFEVLGCEISWIMLSSCMKEWLFQSAKKQHWKMKCKKQVKFCAKKKERKIEGRGKNPTKKRDEEVFEGLLCDFIVWAHGESRAVSCRKGNRASYSKHKHMLSMKDASLKRETRTRSQKVVEIMALCRLWLSVLAVYNQWGNFYFCHIHWIYVVFGQK